MSVSSEWNSLKAAWIILLIALVARIFFSGQFLLTPEEAVFWHAGQASSMGDPGQSPALNWLIRISTGLFGDNEIAVRLPAVLAVTLASFFMALLAASMFSWHTALHLTLLSQGILQLNMAALILSPFSLLLPCWTAACYHSSQAMHNNSTGEWLFAGFWFGLGMLCSFSMALLLPCIILCFILVKPFRTCLFYPGPWLGLVFSLFIFLAAGYLYFGDFTIAINSQKENFTDLLHNLIPDISYSIQFLTDQAILLTPVVFLLILFSWPTGTSKRNIVKADALFLILTSFPLFMLYLIFPFFESAGTSWSFNIFITSIVLIAGLHSSTRSNFKGRPKRRWIVCIVTAYLISAPLLLEIGYPHLSLHLNVPQTRLMTSGWDILGEETEQAVERMAEKDNTFIFSMDARVASELAFYTPGTIQTVSLDHSTRTRNNGYLEDELLLTGRDGVGLISTKAAIEQAKVLFETVELEKVLTQEPPFSRPDEQPQTFYLIRGFNFKKILP